MRANFKSTFGSQREFSQKEYFVTLTLELDHNANELMVMCVNGEPVGMSNDRSVTKLVI